MKYLLVEDNEELRNRIADELRRSTTVAQFLGMDSGEDALVSLERESDTDLVVLDRKLASEMYGKEVLNRVVILAGDPTPEQLTEIIERGANRYMYKSANRYMYKFTFGSAIQIRHYLKAVPERSRSRTGAMSGYRQPETGEVQP